MRTIHDILTDARDAWVYRSARERGDSPTVAMYRVRIERQARDCLAENAYTESWAVIPDATSRHLSVTIPEGAHVTVRVVPDSWGGRPEDNGDCYSPEDILAWENGDWGYGVIEVSVTDDEGDEVGGVALHSVELGDHWPDSYDAQVWAVVADGLLDEALADAQIEWDRRVVLDAKTKATRTALDRITAAIREDAFNGEAIAACDRIVDILTETGHLNGEGGS